MDLERLIDQARASGTLDSSGRFTLDLERAWEKLGQFAAPEMGAFVLYLVRAAVGSGASFVRFREGWGQLALEFPGEVPEPEQLFDHPLSSRAPRWLQELALGIFLALSGRAARSAILESGSRRLNVVLKDDRPQVSVSECAPEPLTRLILGLSLTPFRGSGTRELVRLRCRFAPVPVLWNGRSVVGPPPVDALTAWRHVATDLGLPGLRLPGVPGGNIWEWEATLPLAGVVGFGKAASALTVVLNGVAQEFPWDDSFPGARAWVANPTLRLDLSGNVVLDQAMVNELHRAVLELALCVDSERLTSHQIVDLVRRGVGEPAGRQALIRWSPSHAARPALVGALMCAALRRHEFAEAEEMRAQLWRHVGSPPSFLRRLRIRKPPAVDLAELGTILEDVAVQHPVEALEWVSRTRDLTVRLRMPLRAAGLVGLALRYQRFQTAELLALDWIGVPPGFLRSLSLTRGQALQEVSRSGRYADLLLLLRCLSPHSHMRLWEWLLANGPPELRLASVEGAADDYRWAAARYNDRALCNQESFRWRGQYLKRADELYAEALSLGAEPVRLARGRAAAAAIPIEGLAKGGPRWERKRDFKVGRFLELGPDALLEAEVRAELGELARASALLQGCDGLVAQVDRAIVARLAGGDADVDLSELVSLPARRRTTWEDFPALLQASQNMAPVHERLAARLIRLGELCDRSRRLVLFRTALAVQLRWLGFLDLSRPPSAVLRLKEF